MLDKLFKCKPSEIFKLLSILRVDLYVTLYYIGFSIPMVILSQLVQDKYCINTLGVEVSKCVRLESLGPEFEDIKNSVLTYSTTFAVYDRLTTASPGIILSLFFGHWVDTYPNHIKYLLALPALGGCLSLVTTILNVYYFKAHINHLLWRSIPYALTGGALIVMSGSYTYVARTTQPKYRAVRFAVLDLALFLASPVATAVTGKLLTIKPWLPDQPRNYLIVLFVSFVCYLIGLIWILVFVNDQFESAKDSSDNV
ncbi:uncharacterized protein LOC128386769 [Panonychus citri]|uniref:uncharacterized protein LOC128386769 n=1 Tax=Panonychus citri TaxID=50023 RepID=UPI002307880F|nr:uncharacterized protein LOC128386769 [Panonychus citri]